jgi:two-component system nitrate/nitrite response regulator NarL
MFDPTVVLYAVAQGWIGHRIVGVGMGFGLITVVVADDHPMFLDALEAAMRGDERLSLVASAVDGVTAVDVVTTLVPDVAVLDVRMGEPDGIDIVAQLRARGVRTRVLLVSAHAEVGIARRALQAGAAGYLVKNVTAQELADAVLRVADGETVLCPELQARLLSGLRDGDGPPVSMGELSGREHSVIQLSARGRDPRQIALELGVSPHTVKDYLHRAYTKLGVSDRTAAVAEALRRGLIE